jgi:ubiquinone/menaquinone biosynthesis C-methylase UbiE
LKNSKKRSIIDWYDRTYSVTNRSRIPYDYETAHQIDQIDLKIVLKQMSKTEFASVSLDAGCGSGRLTILCGLSGKKVVGIDISKTRIHEAQQASKRKAFEQTDFLLADTEWLPFRENVFAVVFSLGTMEYVDRPQRILDEWWRTLTPRGRLMFTVANATGVLKKITKVARAYRRSTTLICDILFDWGPSYVRSNMHSRGFVFVVKGYNLSRGVASFALQTPVLRQVFLCLTGNALRPFSVMESSYFGKYICTDLLVEAQKVPE